MKLLLIDGLNLVRRIYSALPEDRRDNFTDQSRFRFVQSCTHSLARALKEHNPSHCLAVFEERQITWRHEIFPQYKNNRKPPPESLIDSLGDVEKAFKETGVSPFRLTGFEADDVIATFATGVANRNGKAVILSTETVQKNHHPWSHSHYCPNSPTLLAFQTNTPSLQKYPIMTVINIQTLA